ncbi:hypothetical protein B0T14DRAFT_478080 [Immersiella caudata]|uniref:Heterokaryon incompatibility domain-containing protein n=1 Tax=Immersiella caudata TaxID=314043 RepID=A0AA39WYK2_9PEZI|nr:hypothetical protein B0T14DRAFT_478080 [Immersiella caudata]
MYCYPYPQASDIAPLRVPYVATVTYSLSGPYNFFSFLNESSCIQVLRAARATPASSSRLDVARNALASTIQSWLFFGLATETLGRDIPHGEFIERSAHGGSDGWIDLRIPSWFWHQLRARWTSLKNTMSEHEYNEKQQRARACVTATKKMLDILDSMVYRPGLDLELGPVLLSVHMLLYLIATIISEIEVPLSDLSLVSTQFLVRRMVEVGWCRKRLNIIDVFPVSYPVLYFLSSFRPPHGESGDHIACTAAKCCVQTGLLEPLHRAADCRCQDIDVSLEAVKRIVASNIIPLIRVKRLVSGGIALEVVPYTRSRRFVAISHVWADRQLGSTKNALPQCQIEYLDQVLAGLPGKGSMWHIKEWLLKRSSPVEHSKHELIEPVTRCWYYFWLDTFCIPQDAEDSDLRSKAINSMNLVYAAASQTLVFDAGLQKFDAGKQPASLFDLAGRKTFYGPRRDRLLELLAHMCASSWMGRAWTLQEGALSGHLIFPLKGSLAYLRVLWNFLDSETSFKDMILFRYERSKHFLMKGGATASAVAPLTRPTNAAEPLRGRICKDVHKIVTASLHVDEHGDYARGPASTRDDRATRFAHTHSLLQSRSTTQLEDLPLILVNMSGMNGNSVTQAKGSDEKMKLLFYGIGILPAELLFSNCARLGCREVDSWIPREITPEKFGGKSTLRLGLGGFTFHRGEGQSAKHLRFFMLSSPAVWQGQAELVLLSENANDGMRTRYLVEDLRPSLQHWQPPSAASCDDRWCILLEDDAPNPRSARFLISRVDGNKTTLHFDCPLKLTKRATTAEEASYVYVGRLADAGHEFAIEKGPTPEKLQMPRPQNRKQVSDRLIVTADLLIWGLQGAEHALFRNFFDNALAKSTTLLVLYGCFSLGQRALVHRVLKELAHSAWMATYDPDWNPNGRWRWFWRLSNYVPPIPFKMMMKYYCRLLISFAIATDNYTLMMTSALYWFPLYPQDELMNLIIGSYVLRFLARLAKIY